MVRRRAAGGGRRTIVRHKGGPWERMASTDIQPVAGRGARAVLAGALTLALVPATVSGQPVEDDPRIGLAPGYFPWSEASSNIDLIDNDPRVAPFDAPPGNFGFVNSDLAFTGTNAIVGSFNGFQVYDLTDPVNPALRGSFVCPGGQGDVSVYGNLLFMSVEETRGRLDCGTQGAPARSTSSASAACASSTSPNLDNPVLVNNVQTCRGSHTHTIVTDPDDPANIYIYNSGTAGVRSPLELAGCENAALVQTPVTTGNPTQWRIDVIKVPLAAPQTAAIVSQPRIFTDPATGAFNGLQNTRRAACCTPRAPSTRRRRTRTPATTSRRTRRSGSPPAPARATASCSTSPTR